MVNFDKIFESFSNKKILVVGDVMIDSYMIGTVERISPEAPIPVIAIDKKENRLGGAANVALNIKSLGAEPIICSVIGNDSYTEMFLNLLNENNLNSEGIITDLGRKTTIKTRVIAKNQHLLRVDEENTYDLDTNIENLLLEKVKILIEKNDISSVIIQDYNKGVVTANLINSLIKITNEKKTSLLVDPKFKNFELYKNLDVLKPNFKEFSIATNTKFSKNEIDNISYSAMQYLKTNNIKTLILTLSEKGILICNKNSCNHYPALDVDIADVSGAGDTVIATLSVCKSIELEDNLSGFISNIAGSLVCEKSGVVQIDKNYLLKRCKENISLYESKK